MIFQKRFKHLATLGGQAEPLTLTDRFGVLKRFRCAPRVVVLAMFQHWADVVHLVSGRRRRSSPLVWRTFYHCLPVGAKRHRRFRPMLRCNI